MKWEKVQERLNYFFRNTEKTNKAIIFTPQWIG